MVDINLATNIKDEKIKQLILNFDALRQRLPKCNCYGNGPTCRNNRCIQNMSSSGVLYTKLDRNEPIEDGNGKAITQDELDDILSKIDDFHGQINSTIEKLEAYIKQNQNSPDINDRKEDHKILRLFFDELAGMQDKG